MQLQEQLSEGISRLPEKINPLKKLAYYLLEFIEVKKGQREFEGVENLPYSVSNIDDRINRESFFYFPNETDNLNLTCFEQNFHLYLAVNKYLPNSNPCFVNITQEKNNLHSGVLFTYENDLHYLDPVQKVLGKAELKDNEVIIEENIVSSVSGEAEKKKTIEFDLMERVSLKTLDDMINNHLRKPDGIIDFLYKSGQSVSKVCEWPYTKELFMYIDDRFNIHGQIRCEDACPSKNNSLIDILYDPFTKKQKIKARQYDSSFWHNIQKEKTLSRVSEKNMTDEIIQTFNIADYFKRTNLSLVSETDHSHRLNIENFPEDFLEAEKLGSEFYNYYLDYVLEDDKENFGIKGDAQLVLSNLKLKLSGKEVVKEVPKVSWEKEFNDRYRFQYFRLAKDFKNYCNYIEKFL